MTTHKDTGIIERTVPKKWHEELIEWKISHFSTVCESEDPLTCYDSPTFIVHGVSWFLRLYPRQGSNFEFLRMSIKSKVKREYALEYNYSMKKSYDGSAEQLASGVLKENFLCSDLCDLIKRSKILQRKSEFIPRDVLTLICRLKYEITHCTQPIVPDETKILKLISLDALSQNFKDLFNDKETCDTTLNVKDKEYKAHRSVLIARSSVFAATFKHDTLERQTGVITIPDCDPDSFYVFLKFLYCGRLEEISFPCALNLYYTSNKYDVEDLEAFCIEYLMLNVTEENICEVAVFADKYDETELFSIVQDFFNKNARKIFLTSEWKCFMKEDNRLASKLLIEMSNVKLKD